MLDYSNYVYSTRLLVIVYRLNYFSGKTRVPKGKHLQGEKIEYTSPWECLELECPFDRLLSSQRLKLKLFGCPIF